MANSSTASGLANWMPISETIRRQPRSSTAIESAERISYLGIVLMNIDFTKPFGRSGSNLTDLRPGPYDHIVELSPIKWNLSGIAAKNGYPDRR